MVRIIECSFAQWPTARLYGDGTLQAGALTVIHMWTASSPSRSEVRRTGAGLVQRARDQAQGGVFVGFRVARVEAMGLKSAENRAQPVAAGGGGEHQPVDGSFPVEEHQHRVLPGIRT